MELYKIILLLKNFGTTHTFIGLFIKFTLREFIESLSAQHLTVIRMGCLPRKPTTAGSFYLDR